MVCHLLRPLRPGNFLSAWPINCCPWGYFRGSTPDPESMGRSCRLPGVGNHGLVPTKATDSWEECCTSVDAWIVVDPYPVPSEHQVSTEDWFGLAALGHLIMPSWLMSPKLQQATATPPWTVQGVSEFEHRLPLVEARLQVPGLVGADVKVWPEPMSKSAKLPYKSLRITASEGRKIDAKPSQNITNLKNFREIQENYPHFPGCMANILCAELVLPTLTLDTVQSYPMSNFHPSTVGHIHLVFTMLSQDDENFQSQTSSDDALFCAGWSGTSFLTKHIQEKYGSTS